MFLGFVDICAKHGSFYFFVGPIIILIIFSPIAGIISWLGKIQFSKVLVWLTLIIKLIMLSRYL